VLPVSKQLPAHNFVAQIVVSCQVELPTDRHFDGIDLIPLLLPQSTDGQTKEVQDQAARVFLAGKLRNCCGSEQRFKTI